MPTKLKKTLALIGMILCCAVLKAVHISGANIEAECLGGGEYQVTLSTFQDCAGASYTSTTAVRVAQLCPTLSFYSQTLSLTETTEVSQLCDAFIPNSTCNSGNLVGKVRLTYSGTISIDPNCSEVRIMWLQNFRSDITINLDNSGPDQQFYTHTYIYPQEDPCNDSPIVTIQESPYVCVGQDVQYNFGVVDPEGDSLHFSFTDALVGTGGIGFGTVNYAVGYSGAAPIPGASIDGETGLISFIAPAQGQYTLAILIEQFDEEGDLLGSVTMDIIIVAEICPNPPPEPSQEALINLLGGAVQTGPLELEMCYGDQFCVDYQFESSVPSADIQVTSNVETILPGATLSFTGGNPSTVTICWEANQFAIDGPIILIADDDLCPVPGIAIGQFTVNVIPGIYAGPDVSICPGQEVQLQAVGDTDYSWETYTGEPIDVGVNFSCDDCDAPVASPTEETEYILTGANILAQCSNKDTIRISMALDNVVVPVMSSCAGDDGGFELTVNSGNEDYALIFGTDTVVFEGSFIDSVGFSAGLLEFQLLDRVASCSADVAITILGTSPPGPDAGAQAHICGLSTIMSANAGTGELSWNATGPGNVVFDNAEILNPEVTVDAAGTYTLYLTETDALNLCTGTDSVQVSFSGPVVAEAGADSTTCELSYTLSATSSAIPGAWLVVPAGPVFSDINAPDATVTFSAAGVYTFFWQLDDGLGCTDADDVTVTVLSTPIANAGDDITSCLLSTPMSATANGGSGSWTIPSGVSINNAIDPLATVSTTMAGTYTLTWTVDNGTCSSSDDVVIVFEDNLEAAAGDDAIICGNSHTLSANGSIGTWSSTPSTLTFDDINSPSAQISNAAPGGYTLTWTVGENECATSDELTLVFIEQPQSFAGNDTAFCGLTGQLQGIESTGTGSWSGPIGITFSAVNDPTSSVTSSNFGTFTLSWSEDNGNGCTASDEVLVTFDELPSPSVPADTLVCGTIVQLSATNSIGAGQWSVDPSLSIADADVPTTVFSTSIFGNFTLTWTETNGACVNDASLDVEFSAPLSPSVGGDQQYCGLSGAIDVSGSLSGQWQSIAGITFDDISATSTDITASGPGTYEIIWLEDGDCGVNDTLQVTFTEEPAAVAGPDTVICGNTYVLQATPSAGIGVWSPTAGIIFDDANTASSSVSATAPGTYTLMWSEDNGNGCVDSDEVILEFLAVPSVDAGLNQSNCGTSTQLNGTSEDAVIIWNSLDAASIDDNSIFDPMVTVTEAGVYSFELLGINGICEARDTVDIIFTAIPSVNAGEDSVICGNQINLYGVSDIGTAEWSSSPGLTFGDVTDVNSVVETDVPGAFTITLTSDNDGCTASDEVIITFTDIPAANAGEDDVVCGLNYELQATSSPDIGTWTEAPGITFSDMNSPNSSITADAHGSYSLEWAVSNGICTSVDTVIVEFSEAPIADAGSDLSFCGNEAEMNAQLTLGVGVWSGSGLVFDDVNNPNSLFTASTGINTATWTVSIGSCIDSAQVQVESLEIPQPEAGTDVNVCGSNAVMAAEDNGISGIWTIPSELSSPSLTNAGAEISTNNFGTYTLYWTEDDGFCSAVDSVEVRFVEQPVAQAGADDALCGSEKVLAANPTVGVTNWTGPAQISFDDNSIPTATASASSAGTYTLTWSAINEELCSASDEVIIEFLDTPISEAGEDIAVCGLAAELEALPTAEDGTWQSSAGITFEEESDPSTGVNSSVVGEYSLIWSVSNGVCSSSDTVLVSFDALPQANAGEDISICGVEAELGASTDIGTGAWTFPIGITGDQNDGSASVNTDGVGIYELTWTVINGECSVSDEVQVEFLDTPISEAGDDVAVCGLQAELNALTSSDAGTWQNTPGIAFDDDTDASAGVTSSLHGEYPLIWSVSNGVCSSTDTVLVSFDAIPEADAGDNLSLCGVETELAASTNIGTGTWVFPAGITGDENDAAALVSADDTGIYELTWSVMNGECTASEMIEVEFLATPDPSAGLDASACGLNATLAASPDLDSGIWSIPEGINLTDQNDPASAITADVPGEYLLTWTEDNGTCIGQDTVTIDFIEIPTSNAGEDISICGLSTSLSGSTQAAEGTWLSATPLDFTDLTDPSATVIASNFGIYELIWSVNNEGCIAEDTVLVEFLDTPLIDAGEEIGSCDNSVELAAEVNIGQGTWTLPSGLSISGNNDPNATITAAEPGEYTLVWSASNGLCSSSDEIVIEFWSAPDTVSVTINCILANTAFTLEFDIQGGDTSTYEVLGGTGEIIDDMFLSDPIPTGESYAFLLSDANDCAPISIEGEFTCASLSYSGTLSGDTLHLCEEEALSVVYNGDAFLDADDTQEFILHDASIGIGTIIDRNPNPSFIYPDGITLGQTYYVSVVVGNDNGLGQVDLVDEGTDISEGSPVIWHMAPSLSVENESIQICEGTPVIFDLSLTGTGPFDLAYEVDGVPFSLNTAGPVVSITHLSNSSIEFLDAQDRYCIASLLPNIEVETLSLPTISAPDSWSYCEGEPESLPLVFTGQAPFAFATFVDGVLLGIEESEGLQFPYSVNQSGQYSFAQLSDNQCFADDSLVVAVDVLSSPPAGAGTSQNACADEEIQLGEPVVGGVVYSWTGSDLLNGQENAAAPIISIENMGVEPLNIALFLETSLGSCSTRDSVDITFFPLPTEFGIEAPDSLCEGSVASISAFGGTNYSWNDTPGLSATDLAQPNIEALSSTTYVVEIVNEYGCSVMDSSFIEVLALPQTEFVMDIESGCPPLVIGITNITSGDISECNWNYGAAEVNSESCQALSLTLTEPGSQAIYLQVFNSAGCSAVFQDTAFVEDAAAAFTVIPEQPMLDEQAQVIDLSMASISSTWSLNGDSAAIDAFGEWELEGLRPGFYELCLSIETAAGCEDIECKDIEIRNNVNVWVPNAFSPDEEDRLNPRFGAVVSGQEWVDQYLFRVFDRRGHIIYETLDVNGSWDGTDLRLRPTPTGMYTWRIDMKVFGEAQPRQYGGNVTLLR